ncbi:MAG: hypothetical protein D5R96_02015 [Methanocalculus sp. MSAO_Arc2]|uniref:hypothetical protein n=1 Tax=Methanocalculus sp. MSAO_Arc2 TaxID=2293855 RepID=UPI000FF71271|nr:MAG: hypothetical protein D5R96_02015 [Methanocalculus sp. MSAO_Arc2]
MFAAQLLRDTTMGRGEALHALRHLPLSTRKGLVSFDYETRRRAEGRFFEAAIYELLRKAGEDNPRIQYIAAFGADAPVYNGQKQGIWYSRDGGIRICSGGRVRAEIDLLFADTFGTIYFAESTIVHPSPSAFIREVREKTALLTDLADGRPVEFLYISTTPPPPDLYPLFVNPGSWIVLPDLLLYIRELEQVVGSPRKRRALPHQKVVHGQVILDMEPVGALKPEKRDGLSSYIQRFFLK